MADALSQRRHKDAQRSPGHCTPPGIHRPPGRRVRSTRWPSATRRPCRSLGRGTVGTPSARGGHRYNHGDRWRCRAQCQRPQRNRPHRTDRGRSAAQRPVCESRRYRDHLRGPFARPRDALISGRIGLTPSATPRTRQHEGDAPRRQGHSRRLFARARGGNASAVPPPLTNPEKDDRRDDQYVEERRHHAAEHRRASGSSPSPARVLHMIGRSPAMTVDTLPLGRRATRLPSRLPQCGPRQRPPSSRRCLTASSRQITMTTPVWTAETR